VVAVERCVTALNLKRVQVFFLDLDGVLSLGKERPTYLGGREVVAKIKATGRRALVLTNDSVGTKNEIHKHLAGFGFSFEPEDIMTSASLTAQYLSENFGRASFYLIAEEGFRR